MNSSEHPPLTLNQLRSIHIRSLSDHHHPSLPPPSSSHHQFNPHQPSNPIPSTSTTTTTTSTPTSSPSSPSSSSSPLPTKLPRPVTNSTTRRSSTSSSTSSNPVSISSSSKSNSDPKQKAEVEAKTTSTVADPSTLATLVTTAIGSSSSSSSSLSSSLSSCSPSRSSNLPLTESNHHPNKSRMKPPDLTIAQDLLDTFISISIPTHSNRSEGMETEIELMKTEVEYSNSNPNYSVDFERTLNQRNLLITKKNYHHDLPDDDYDQLQNNYLFVHQHSLKNSRFIILNLYARPHSRPLNHHQSNLQNQDQNFHLKNLSKFNLIMTWFIDFDQLVFLAETDIDSSYHTALMNSINENNNTRGMKMKMRMNELYLSFDSGVYKFEPIDPQQDLKCEKTSIKLIPPPPGQEILDDNGNNNKIDLDPHHYHHSFPINDVKSFSINDLIRYMEIQVELSQTLQEIFDLESSISTTSKNDIQGSQTSHFHLSRKYSEIFENLNSLNSQLTSTEIDLLKLQDQFRERKREIQRRREVNESGRALLNDLIKEKIEERRMRLNKIELPRQVDSRRELNRRRSKLIEDLSTIYPIEPISSGDDPLLFSIAQIILPNLEPNQPIASNLMITSNGLKSSSSSNNLSLLPSSTSISLTNPTAAGFLQFFKPIDLADDDRIVSTALGFTSHLIKLISSYLAVPLPYPLSFIGSRSLVSDFISRISGPRSFPLYFKGVDRFRFEYAVFLLNKNIEQVMYHQKVVISDLRHTLPNLKNLLLTLESNPATLLGETEINSSMIDLINPETQNQTINSKTSSSNLIPTTPMTKAFENSSIENLRLTSSPSLSFQTPGPSSPVDDDDDDRLGSTDEPNLVEDENRSCSLSPSSSSIHSSNESSNHHLRHGFSKSDHSYSNHHHSRQSSRQSEKTLK